MGRQVRFYMTDEDTAEFLRFAGSDRNVGVFMVWQASEEIAFLDELPAPGTSFGYALCLWDRDGSPKPILTYVPPQQYYSVDEIDSEVIQLHRSCLDATRLSQGRIWAEFSVWRSDGTLQRKSKRFEQWFGRLARWIKRNYAIDDDGDYVGPGAAKYAALGGKLGFRTS